MQEFITPLMIFIQTHINEAPFIIYLLLLLGGLNIPISEDALIFITAVLANKFPEHKVQLFLGLYLGAWHSGLVCYTLGRVLRDRLWRIRFFSRMIKPTTFEKIKALYERWGLLTLIIGRFIPFGIRNGLFLTAGISRMKFIRFFFYDWPAATIAVSTYFVLYSLFEEKIEETVSDVQSILGILFFLAITILLSRQFSRLWKNRRYGKRKRTTITD